MQAIAMFSALRWWEHLLDRRHTRPVVVDPGEKHRPRRRTQRRGVIAGEHGPPCGEPVDIGRVRLTAEGAQIHKGRIVHQQDHDIRLRGRCCGVFCLHGGRGQGYQRQR